MAYSSDTAHTLIGAARTADFQCNHVVNQILTGNKVGILAREYLDWGKPTDKPAAGVVVVGKDGVHVGIFISEEEFIHSSTSKKKVIRAPLSQLPYVFPNEWVYRKEK
jgi:hypothetical protein